MGPTGRSGDARHSERKGRNNKPLTDDDDPNQAVRLPEQQFCRDGLSVHCLSRVEAAAQESKQMQGTRQGAFIMRK